MVKKETTTKQPKTVEVKLLVPYGIIFTMIVAGAGLIGGWAMHIEQQSQVKQEAYSIVQDLKTESR